MERRRRALGLRNLDNKKDLGSKQEKTDDSKRSVGNIGNTSRENPNKEVKETPSHQTGSVTPQHKNATRRTSESPHSPALQSLLPRTLGSPEVEVSWDWGCSQVPRDLLPKRRAKCVTQPLPVQVPLHVPVAIYSRFPLERKMSEEENQEKLAFYKSVLSRSLRRVADEKSDDSKNNNLDKEAVPEKSDDSKNNNLDNEAVPEAAAPVAVTPKRPTKYRTSSARKEEINEFFDDSANEFMLECSQAVEEQLRNGLIDMGPIVKVTIPSHKHVHSPDLESEHSHKKLCHVKTKLNLFPEQCSSSTSNGKGSPRSKQPRLSLKSPKNKMLNFKNCDEVPVKLTSTHSDDIENDLLSMLPTQENPNLTLKETSGTCVPFGEKEDKNMVKSTHNLTKTGASCDNRPALPQVKQNCSSAGNVNRLTSHTNSSLSCNTSLIANRANNIPAPLRKPGGNNVQPVENRYDCLAKFRKAQNGTSVTNANQNVPKPQTAPNTVINAPNCGTKSVVNGVSSAYNAVTNSINSGTSQVINRDRVDPAKSSVVQQTSSANQQRDPKLEPKNSTIQGSRSNVTDFTSLLDDGLDMELSSLDFDSLCCDNEFKEPPLPQPPKSTSQLCSQQEIEAKRIAALNRLMMKKRR